MTDYCRGFSVFNGVFTINAGRFGQLHYVVGGSGLEFHAASNPSPSFRYIDVMGRAPTVGKIALL